MTATNSDALTIISRAITVLELVEDAVPGSQQIRILDLLELLRNERIKIVKLELETRNQTYAALTEGIKEAKEQLDDLVEEIAELIGVAEQAARVVGAILKLVGFLARIP